MEIQTVVLDLEHRFWVCSIEISSTEALCFIFTLILKTNKKCLNRIPKANLLYTISFQKSDVVIEPKNIKNSLVSYMMNFYRVPNESQGSI